MREGGWCEVEFVGEVGVGNVRVWVEEGRKGFLVMMEDFGEGGYVGKKRYNVRGLFSEYELSDKDWGVRW